MVVLGLGAFFYHKVKVTAEADRVARAQAEQRLLDEAKARQKAEQEAKAQAEALKRAQEEVAQKNAAAEALAKKAEEEAKQREGDANRILNARGSLAIETEPPGAAIAISNFAARVSPTTIEDLRLGRYTVNLSMPGYDPMSVQVEIKENAAANPGVLKLVRQTGSLEITTDPPGASFEIRPAPPHVAAEGSPEVKNGKTPATLAGLPTGEYTVTFRREGWPEHAENVVIEHGKTAHVAWKYLGGSVTITSAPAGAHVTRNGEAIGDTPLTLNDQLPGDVTYNLDLPGFLSATVEGRIEAEKTLALDTSLRAEDRIVSPRELDEQPVAVKMVKPEVGYEITRNGATATISLVVDRDGTPKDIRVESSTDSEFGRRCVAAAAQWRFRPGTIKGVPVRTRVSIPFSI